MCFSCGHEVCVTSIPNTLSYTRNLPLNSLNTPDPHRSSNSGPLSTESARVLCNCFPGYSLNLQYYIAPLFPAARGVGSRASQPREPIMDPGNADPPVNQEVITVFAMTLESPT